MVLIKVLAIGWMFVGISLMGSETAEKEKEPETVDWTGCNTCTSVLLQVKDKQDIQTKYLNCLNPLSMKFLMMTQHASQTEMDDLKDQAQSCTEILLDEMKSNYQVEVGDIKTSVKNVCQKCKVYRLATNTLNFIHGKVLKDRQDMAVKVVMGGAMLGAASAASGFSAAGQSTTIHEYRRKNVTTNLNPENGMPMGTSTHFSRVYTDSWGSALTNLDGFIPMFTAGATSVATTGAGVLAVYGAFKLGKAAADRPSCEFACGTGKFNTSTKVFNKLAGIFGKKYKSDDERINHNQVLAQISGIHFKNSAKILAESLKKEKEENGTSDLSKKFALSSPIKDPGAQISYLISLFSTAIDPNLAKAAQVAGRCLMKCPVDLTYGFMCEMIKKLDMDETLRLGQLLSVHDNLISVNTIRNTNLAKFLMAIRNDKSSRMQGFDPRYDEQRYASVSAGGKCGEASAEKIQALIHLQLFMERMSRKHLGEIRYASNK